MMAPMGYRGKTLEQDHARKLRAEGWVSLWCREVDVDEEIWSKRVRENKRFEQ